MIIPDELIASSKKGTLIPFIGAGFSTIADLPSWSQLIAEISVDLGFDPEIASIYGDFLQLAEYLSIEQSGIGKLRSKLDKRFNESKFNIS
jgi:hypothetical protein